MLLRNIYLSYSPAVDIRNKWKDIANVRKIRRSPHGITIKDTLLDPIFFPDSFDASFLRTKETRGLDPRAKDSLRGLNFCEVVHLTCQMVFFQGDGLCGAIMAGGQTSGGGDVMFTLFETGGRVR